MKMNVTLDASYRFLRKYKHPKLTPEKKKNPSQYISTEDAKLSKSKLLQKYQVQNIPQSKVTIANYSFNYYREQNPKIEKQLTF